jgi:hypothetical protein
MTTETDLSVTDRLTVLDHLGIERLLRGLHAADVTGFVQRIRNGAR